VDLTFFGEVTMKAHLSCIAILLGILPVHSIVCATALDDYIALPDPNSLLVVGLIIGVLLSFMLKVYILPLKT
jgi:hypothetical protein